MAENELFEVKWSNPARISSFSPNMGIWGWGTTRERDFPSAIALALRKKALAASLQKLGSVAVGAGPRTLGFQRQGALAGRT